MEYPYNGPLLSNTNECISDTQKHGWTLMLSLCGVNMQYTRQLICTVPLRHLRNLKLIWMTETMLSFWYEEGRIHGSEAQVMFSVTSVLGFESNHGFMGRYACQNVSSCTF